jgi:hypothetical protein
MPRSESIAEGLKNNRRLATFHMDKPEEFLDYLKTRYESELQNWYWICSRDDWKFEFIARELKIRTCKRRMRELMAARAEYW